MLVVYIYSLPEYAWNVHRPSDRQQLYKETWYKNESWADYNKKT